MMTMRLICNPRPTQPLSNEDLAFLIRYFAAVP